MRAEAEAIRLKEEAERQRLKQAEAEKAKEERRQTENLRAQKVQSEKYVQNLLKAAKMAYKEAERANALAQTLKDALIGAPDDEREEIVKRASAAVKAATEAQAEWDASYARAKEAIKAL